MKSNKNISEQWVTRFNQFFGSLLGKSHKSPNKHRKPKVTPISNLSFVIIVAAGSIMLWIFTGFYYIPEGKIGIVLQNGHIYKMIDSENIGFSLPYPFGEVVALEDMHDTLLDTNPSSQRSMIVLSANLVPISINTKFNYQIINPKKLDFNVVVTPHAMQNLVAWNVEVQLKNYIVSKTNDAILRDNLTVTATQIKNQVNNNLASSGIRVDRLELTHLAQVDNEQADNTATSINPTAHNNQADDSRVTQLIAQLLAQANAYHDNKLAFTHSMLSSLQNIESSNESAKMAILKTQFDQGAYPLLNMNLAQLINYASSDSTDIESSANRDDIVRGRNLESVR